MKPRVCAVSYLNTTPLVWGLLHGPQKSAFDLRFEIPSRCADLVRAGEVDIGLVPVIEFERQALEIIPGLGIASDGPVRSILLITRGPVGQIRSVAMDASSRTSVVLSRILLRERYGVEPEVIDAAPDATAMLERADAALLIGDAALRVAAAPAGLVTTDLGAVWTEWTGLPMVYAMWAARAGFDIGASAEVLGESYRFGRARIGEIAAAEAEWRGIPERIAEEYLTRNIHFELGREFEAGLARYRALAREMGLV